MMQAIRSHNVDFVELLLDNAINIKRFLTEKRLMDLYFSEIWKERTLWTLLLNLRGQTELKFDIEIKMTAVGEWITQLLDECYLQKYITNPGKQKTENAPFENPFLHLLIWAVLSNLQDMAKLFWRKGLDSIAAALLAHALLSAMARRLKNANPDLSDDIEANSREFMDLATGVLERCYKTNKKTARDILIGELLQWDKASCILIAIKTNNKSFISATACQEVFTNAWMGEMTQENGILKLLMCTFIPPLIPLCVKFKKNHTGPDDANSVDAHKEELKKQRSPLCFKFKKNKRHSLDDDNDDSDECDNDFLQQVNRMAGVSGTRTSLKPGYSYHVELALDYNTIRVTPPRNYDSRAKNKIPLFYQAPVVHFISHVISYMAFLCLYSYVLISKFDQNVSVEDVILIVWVANIFIEEITQVIATRHVYTRIKLKAYIADLWNITDILMILLFVIGMILKYLPYQGTLEAARIVVGVNLIICFLRLLQMFSLNKELGPKLVMIIRMVRNLTSFFVILLIFIVAYAIASYAILYPNTEISFIVLRDIFRRPYWNIYGELMLDEIEGTNDCTNSVELYRNGTQPRCTTEYGRYFVPVLMGVYMLMCNILLLNLLISIFSNTFQMVQENADKHWRIQRYYQIQEYITRSMFVPPISFLEIVIKTIVVLKRNLCGCKTENSTSGTNVFLQPFSEKVLPVTVRKKDYRHTVRKWERNIAQDLINSNKADLEIVEKSEKEITLRLDKLVSKVDALEEKQHALTAAIENARLHLSQTDCMAKSESSTVDEPDSVTEDQRMDNREEQVPWIDDIPEEHNPGAE